MAKEEFVNGFVKIHTKAKLCLRVWDAEREACKSAATREGMTLDEWARHVLWMALPTDLKAWVHHQSKEEAKDEAWKGRM
jgi:hypothetical protein